MKTTQKYIQMLENDKIYLGNKMYGKITFTRVNWLAPGGFWPAARG